MLFQEVSTMSEAITPIKSYHLVVLALLGVFMHLVSYAETFIFTDQSHPMINTGKYPVYYLDAPMQLESQLSEGLSKEPVQAQQQALQRIQNKTLQKQLLDSYLPVVKAWQLGVTKVPAVVNDQYVVYGQPDVQKALQQIADYQQGNQ